VVTANDKIPASPPGGAELFQTGRILPPKHILQILPDVLLPQPREVGVDIPRCSDVRMTQPLLNVFQLPSVVVENARRAVTDRQNR